MKTQTVYVPVSVGERLPEDKETYFVSTNLSEHESAGYRKGKWSGSRIWNDEIVTHWLEPQQLIAFTQDEFKQAIIDAYKNGFYAGCDQPLFDTMPEQYYNETYQK